MAARRLICRSDVLADAGSGVRFTTPHGGREQPAFVVRFRGQVHGYLNQCAHIPVEMDWQEGEFFSIDKTHLVCATHGATYAPDSGYCVWGPCKGRFLTKLPVVEQDGDVWLEET